MASIRRQGGVLEIRECVATPVGPRQRALARFRGVLTADVLDRAAEAATRPFDRAVLLARARRAGIPVSERHADTGARRLLAHLRAGLPLDPVLVGLLRGALGLAASAPLPPHLADVADWIGASEASRGRALRGLSRAASRVVRSRGAVREPEPERFPRFSSGEAFA
jgi:hypothetical protein